MNVTYLDKWCLLMFIVFTNISILRNEFNKAVYTGCFCNSGKKSVCFLFRVVLLVPIYYFFFCDIETPVWCEKGQVQNAL